MTSLWYFVWGSKTEHFSYTCADTEPLLQPLIIIPWLWVYELEIEQQMKTLSRLSYLLSQLIPTPGCLLLSCQQWEWQVENGIPPSALLFYWIFFPPYSFYCFFWWIENNFPACILRGHTGEGKKNKQTRKKVADGKVGVEEEEEVRVADMLIVRDKHFSAVVIQGEAMTSLACWL